LALLGWPSATVALLVRVPLEAPAALTVARVGGAGLLALGVACWFARGDTQSRAARGLVAAMLLYDVAAVAVLAFAGIGFGLHGVALWPAVVSPRGDGPLVCRVPAAQSPKNHDGQELVKTINHGKMTMKNNQTAPVHRHPEEAW